ncbi:unnamed protein product [Thelazia callipaeda]|uniref:SCP domain-containing protein n=1 Tax=Thelazia callipaeda TaxID=103827 RepID=A0A0N5CWT7_THECL|nr:unnamed protein product [Thelazia callipaeda]
MKRRGWLLISWLVEFNYIEHGAPPLTLNEELCGHAQLWANKLAEKGHIAFCEQQGIGENITFFPLDISAEKVVEHWYSEHVKYKYETPGWQLGTNYFTQIVWKASKEVEMKKYPCLQNAIVNQIGIGRSIVWNEASQNMDDSVKGKREQVIVAFYSPAGNNNRFGQFASNVQKPSNICTS